MGRIIAIDYGKKRTGIAVSDPLKIIATGLATIASDTLISFLKKYMATESVELIVLGLPVNLNNEPTHGTALAENAFQQLSLEFPAIPIKKLDERFTSKMAQQTLIEMGLPKNKRRDKSRVDEIAATILLQGYMSTL